MGEDKRPTVISTFAGIGGSSLGYRWAGFKELLAIDFNDYCEKIFKLNFPDVPFWKRDMTKVLVDDVLNFVNIGIGDLDILDGSPPCQGFSTAGKMEVSDERNDLFLSFIRLAEGLRPKAFIMENVSGQAKGKMKGKFKEIIAALKSFGYNVKAKLMNAKYYGVPQSRERIFYVGIRSDIGKSTYPKPDIKIISVRAAFKGLKNNDLTGTNLSPFIKPWLRLMAPGEGADRYHPKKIYYNHRRIPWDAPSNTVAKVKCLYHPFEDRYLSIPEVKRLCSFPDDFKLVGSVNKQWGGLGNAVMPRQMEAIARHIKENVLKY